MVQEYANQLNYKTRYLYEVVDFYDEKVYPLKDKNLTKYKKIMSETYDITHESTPSKARLDDWSEKFPVMLDKKIETEKKKLKRKIKDPKKRKEAQKRYKVSQLRNRNIISQMSKQGYFGISESSKKGKMKAGLKDDEIISDLVAEISDPYGGDHDMVEIKYDDQFRQHIKEYEDRYKYAYIVEDKPPIKKLKKPIKKKPPEKKNLQYIRKQKEKEAREKQLDALHFLKQSKTKIQRYMDEPDYNAVKTRINLSRRKLKYLIDEPRKSEWIKTVKKWQEKLEKKFPERKPKKEPISTLIVSKNPIKISPVKKIEFTKPKPKPKPRKKTPVKKKKPIKKKIPIKKKAIPKKKPIKKKYPRAKKKGSPITGHWTARYRTIKGKKTKVMIRKRKGKIQIQRCR